MLRLNIRDPQLQIADNAKRHGMNATGKLQFKFNVTVSNRIQPKALGFNVINKHATASASTPIAFACINEI